MLKKVNDFEVGEVINLSNMGNWRIIGIDKDFIRLEKVGDIDWT